MLFSFVLPESFAVLDVADDVLAVANSDTSPAVDVFPINADPFGSNLFAS